MKINNSIIGRILSTDKDFRMVFIRLIVGSIFLVEGFQKFMVVSVLGPAYFEEIGFGRPMFWAHFTGSFEIVCGFLILAGFLTRIAVIPLMVVMVTAFFTTKLPMLLTKGFLTFSHEYAIDFSLTVLLIVLMIYGGGKWPADLIFNRRKDTI